MICETMTIAIHWDCIKTSLCCFKQFIESCFQILQTQSLMPTEIIKWLVVLQTSREVVVASTESLNIDCVINKMI